MQDTNSTPTILIPSNVNFDLISYSTPNNSSASGRLVYLNYQNEQNEKIPFLVKIPKLDCRHGLKSLEG